MRDKGPKAGKKRNSREKCDNVSGRGFFTRDYLEFTKEKKDYYLCLFGRENIFYQKILLNFYIAIFYIFILYNFYIIYFYFTQLFILYFILFILL